MARVVVSAPADSDRRDIVDYLAAHAGYVTAERYNAAFSTVYRRLADFPDIGSPRPALGDFVRVAFVHPFLVIYEHTDDLVTIFRVLHGRRDVTRDLLKR